jgi:hypothetical protein
MQANILLDLLQNAQVSTALGKNGRQMLCVTLPDGSELVVGFADDGSLQQVLHLRDVGEPAADDLDTTLLRYLCAAG